MKLERNAASVCYCTTLTVLHQPALSHSQLTHIQTNSKMNPPLLLSKYVSRQVLHKSKVEEVIGCEGRDFPNDSPVLSIKDIVLLGEKIRREHYGHFGARTLTQPEKIRALISNLKAHCSLLAPDKQIRSEKVLWSKLKRLLSSATDKQLNSEKKVAKFKSALDQSFDYLEDISDSNSDDTDTAPEEMIESDKDEKIVKEQSKVDENWRPETDVADCYIGPNMRDAKNQTEPHFFSSSESNYNTLSLKNYVAAVEQCGTIGLNKAALLANALLKDVGMIGPDDKHLLITHRKIERERDKLRAAIKKTQKRKFEQSPPIGILFDSKIMQTLVESKDVDTGAVKRRRMAVDQYVVTTERGEFLESFEIIKDNSATESHAKRVAKKLKIVCDDHNITNSIQVVGGDTTNTNTGWKGGIFSLLERELGKRLFRVECQLHINELALRDLISLLIGETTSKHGLKGRIGELLLVATEMPSTAEIEIIPNNAHFTLPEEIIADLSADQKYMYLAWSAVVTGDGTMWQKVINLSVGPLAKSRWLTTACRLLRLWLADKDSRDLSEDEEKNLETVVSFISNVYVPMWFEIKKSQFNAGPQNLLKYLQLLQNWPRNEEITKILRKSLLNNSYWAAPDKILLYGLTSENRDYREKAVNIILDIRGENNFGAKTPSFFTYGPESKSRKPVVNMAAQTVFQMIPDEDFHHEPAFTVDLSNEDLNNIRGEALIVPEFEGHTQCVERMIRRTSEASSCIWSKESRDLRIQTQQVVSQHSSNKSRTKIGFKPFLDFEPPKLRKTKSA